MGSSGVFKGLPNGVMSQNWLGSQAIKVENNCLHTSVPLLFTGNVTEQVLVAPTNGDRIVIKAITIVAEGNTGKVKVIRENGDVVILPLYVTAHNHTSTSSALNIVLDPAEKVLVTTAGRGTNDETFIGVTYLEVL